MKIGRLRHGECFEGQQVNFELDSEFHGKRVEPVEGRGTASVRWGPSKNLVEAVLDSLQPAQVLVRDIEQECVAVVQLTGRKVVG